MTPFSLLQLIRTIVNHICGGFAAQYEDHCEKGTKMASADTRWWRIAVKIKEILVNENINEN